MGWVITNTWHAQQKGSGKPLYVKRTCTRYGNFYGQLILTDNRAEARVWSRRKDVTAFAKTIISRHYSQTHGKYRPPEGTVTRENIFTGGYLRLQVESEDGRTGFGVGEPITGHKDYLKLYGG